MQEAVGGWIEEHMPFPDEVALSCNEEGKMNRMHSIVWLLISFLGSRLAAIHAAAIF